jgi:anti-anti-sigma factor
MGPSVPRADGDRIPQIVVVVTEALDTSAVPRLSGSLDEALTLRPEQLVIDLNGCPFIDAAAIELFLEVHRRVRRTGGLLTLRSPSPRLRRNLRLTRADRVLHITPAPPPEPVPVYSGTPTPAMSPPAMSPPAMTPAMTPAKSMPGATAR